MSCYGHHVIEIRERHQRFSFGRDLVGGIAGRDAVRRMDDRRHELAVGLDPSGLAAKRDVRAAGRRIGRIGRPRCDDTVAAQLGKGDASASVSPSGNLKPAPDFQVKQHPLRMSVSDSNHAANLPNRRNCGDTNLYVAGSCRVPRQSVVAYYLRQAFSFGSRSWLS